MDKRQKGMDSKGWSYKRSEQDEKAFLSSAFPEPREVGELLAAGMAPIPCQADQALLSRNPSLGMAVCPGHLVLWVFTCAAYFQFFPLPTPQ